MPAPKPCSKRQLEYASKISQMTGKKLPEYMNQRTLSAYIGANQDEYFRLKDIADRQNQNILIERHSRLCGRNWFPYRSERTLLFLKRT